MLATATHKVGDPLAFYEVTATILPVLFLALIYQARALDPLTHVLRVSGSFLLYILVALGELEALKVLASREPSARSEHVITTVVGLVLLGVAISPALDVGRRLPPKGDRTPRPRILGIPGTDNNRSRVSRLIMIGPGVAALVLLKLL